MKVQHPLRCPMVLLFGVLLLVGTRAAAEDWPYWRGTHHDGISRETGLLKTWPEAGPKVLWRRPVPGGFSSVSVAGGRLFTLSEDNKEEIVLCVDARTGTPLWEYRYPCDYDQHPTLDQRFKSGPRSTPTVDGDHVYTIGTTGQMHCLDVKTGGVVWKRDLLQLAGRTAPEFGYTGSPLVVGDKVFVHPGGQNGTSVAALNKRDGTEAWKSLNDPIGYSTPVLIQHEGTPQLIHFTGQGIVAVAPADGRQLWRYDWKTAYDLNVATPIYANGQLFLSSNYGRGCALVRVKNDGPPEEVYKSLSMQNHFSSSVLYQGHVYGFSNDRLRCIDMATGTMKWDQRGLGRGSLLIADGHLLILGENGELVLAEASPMAYTEKGRAKALKGGPCWTGPALANGVFYARNETELVAVEVGAPK